MATTRAQIEQVTVNRLSGLMATVGFAVTYAGANASLNDPIGWAIRQLGGTVTSIILVTDSDVLTVDADDLDALLALTELRTLKNIAGNYALVDIGAGPEKESLSQVMNNLEKRIAGLESDILYLYQIGPAMEVTISEILHTPFNGQLS